MNNGQISHISFIRVSEINSVTRSGEFSPIWVIFFFGQLFKIAQVAQIFGLLLLNGYCYVIIITKTGWATFLAIFYKPIWSRWRQMMGLELCAGYRPLIDQRTKSLLYMYRGIKYPSTHKLLESHSVLAYGSFPEAPNLSVVGSYFPGDM
jgi:hypothetical protein